MARASAARATTRAEAIWGVDRFGAEAEAPDEGLALKRLAFVACAICLFALCEFAGVLSTAAHDSLLANAGVDLELFSRAVWRDLAEAIAAGKDQATIGEPLFSLAPHHAARGRRILVTDAHGAIVASWPQTARSGAMLTDILGDQPLRVDKYGVMHVVLGDGAPALAILRRLPPPFGEVATIQPQDAALLEWRTISWRYALLFATTTLVLLAILVGYLRQARRRRAAEEMNRRIRRRLATALSRGRCGLWDWDIAGGHVYWSVSMHEMLGREPTQTSLSIAELAELIHPDDRDIVRIAATIASGRASAIDREFRICNAQGDFVWLRARAELVRDADRGGAHLVGIAVDVTEQKVLAETAAAADRCLRDAIDSISEAFVLWDAQRRLVTCNEKFLELHGFSGEEAIAGAAYDALMSRARAPALKIDVPTSEAATNEARAYEVRLGDGRWLQINERRTRDGGHVSVGADVTLLKRNEENLLLSEHRLTLTVADLRKSRQNLEMQKQELAALAEQLHFQKSEADAANLAKSAFLANMSHELRTPLNAIVGFSEMMLQQCFGEIGDPKYLEYCRDIHRSGAQLDQLVTDILEMSRLEFGAMELQESDVDLVKAVHDAVCPWRRRADEKQVALALDVENELICSGDHAAIVKIVGALVSNSVKFTAPGGAVLLRARRRYGDVCLSVADNGRGVEPQALRRLGAPFVQSQPILENGMKGSGLGLAIARALTHLHGGSLRLRSRPGLGTIAVLRLPSSEARDAARELRSIAAKMKAMPLHEAPAAPRPLHVRSDPGAATGVRVTGSEKTTRKPGALSSKRKLP
jgi:two-component system cell cycle sensor histidine kinase PleC